jgi:hypothetical protein
LAAAAAQRVPQLQELGKAFDHEVQQPVAGAKTVVIEPQQKRKPDGKPAVVTPAAGKANREPS